MQTISNVYDNSRHQPSLAIFLITHNDRELPRFCLTCTRDFFNSRKIHAYAAQSVQHSTTNLITRWGVISTTKLENFGLSSTFHRALMTRFIRLIQLLSSRSCSDSSDSFNCFLLNHPPQRPHAVKNVSVSR